MRLFLLLLLSLLAGALAGCPTSRGDDDVSDDDDSASDDDDVMDDDDSITDDDDSSVDDDDDDVDDDDSAVAVPTELSGFAYDPDLGPGDEGALEGATIRESADPSNTVQSGSDGTWTMTVTGGSDVALITTAAGRVESVTLLDTVYQRDREAGVMNPAVSESMLDQITSYAWSQAYDPATATIWVGGWPAADGLVVDLDVGYLGAVAFGTGAPAVTNIFTTGVFQLGFFGVEPGSVSFTLTGDECFGVHDFDVEAGKLYYTSVLCTP